MKILILNSGSSSIKYKLFEMPGERIIAKGLVEKIGEKSSKINHDAGGKKSEKEEQINNHEKGLKLIIDLLVDENIGVIKNVSEISAVGHRVVHGGEAFTDSVIITDEVVKAIQEFIYLAPLHNPPNLAGIKAARELLPRVTQVASFDTSFHQTIPKTAYLYAIPYEFYEKHKIRKYGFHGTSHRYIARRAAELMKKDKYGINAITCHLGNGCSISAVEKGKSVDTSMGLTPLEGIIMGTRSGDIDPAIIFFLEEKAGIKINEINNILNKKSGLLGVSGVSNDVRNIENAAKQGNERAKLSLDMFCYRIKKYIGSYMVVLNKVDAIVFTGGIGENAVDLRAQICGHMEFWGIKIDKNRNESKEKEKIISTDDSKVKVFVIPTDEEVRIAVDTFEMVSRKK
ncbi:MAG: acetate kinase [Candidatus Firestonebacteria bacterium]